MIVTVTRTVKQPPEGIPAWQARLEDIPLVDVEVTETVATGIVEYREQDTDEYGARLHSVTYVIGGTTVRSIGTIQNRVTHTSYQVGDTVSVKVEDRNGEWWA